MVLVDYSAIYMKKHIQSKQQTQSLCTQLCRLVGSFVLLCLAHHWFLVYNRVVAGVRQQRDLPAVKLAHPRMDITVPTHTCTPALRLVVLTANRAESLHRLLAVLARVDYGGDCVALDVCIERSEQGELDAGTVAVAHSFAWPYGPKSVHTRAILSSTSNVSLLDHHETAFIVESRFNVARFLPADTHECVALTRYLQTLRCTHTHGLCSAQKQKCLFKWIAREL
jgi:hypothetical protein